MLSLRDLVDLNFGGSGSGCNPEVGKCGRKANEGEITDKHGVTYTVKHSTREDEDGTVRHKYEVFEKPDENGFEKQVGGVDLNRKGDAAMSVGVYPEYQRRSIATELYKYIEKDLGYKLKPNKYQTDEGQAFWKSKENVT